MSSLEKLTHFNTHIFNQNRFSSEVSLDWYMCWIWN